MKFFRLDLLTLLISLFILNGCKNKGTIGFNPNASVQLNGALIDTSTIVVNTFQEDSVQTSGLSKIPLGYFNDPVFGTTESNIAAALNLPGSTAYSLPTGTIRIDSAVLVMPYADGFYGDSLTSRYNVNVYQLTSRPLNKKYYNTDSWAPNPLGPVLGTRSFLARPHDSVTVQRIISGKPDSIMKVGPQLRIPMDKTFVNNILFNANSAMLASNTVFLNTVKGLYLTIGKAGVSGGVGGTVMFTSADSLKVYYRAINGTTIDTVNVVLPLNNQAAEIKHNASTTLSTEFTDTISSRDLMYFQGLAGSKVRIKFPYLTKLIPSIGSNIAINRAELVVTPDPGTIPPLSPYYPLPKLTMYRYDIAHQKIELEDATQNDPRYQSVATFGGYYSPSFKSYHFVITGYIQDLVNGKTVDYGTYLAPVDTTNKTAVDINPNPQATGRTIAVGSDKNSPYRIRLNIIYTKINKSN
jgi:hypothetical protein